LGQGNRRRSVAVCHPDDREPGSGWVKPPTGEKNIAMKKMRERNMNQDELIEKVADECGLSKYATSRVLESVLSAISEAMAANEKVKLMGLGTLSVAQRPPCGMRVLQSDDIIRIPARKAIRFTSETAFIEAVRSGC
jgi:DNA-binding protein HU-beta